MYKIENKQRKCLISTPNAPLVFLVEAEDEGEHHVPLVRRRAVVEAVLLRHPLPPQKREIGQGWTKLRYD